MIIEPSGNPTVTGAIRQAARMTGADFKYLLATAQAESALNPNAQVSTSSARGLFQFIEQTWIATLKERGPALGYEPYANAITRTPSGQYAVTDPRMYSAIMNLRSDPTANALMAGAYTKANIGKLADWLGRKPTDGEVYVAHFLGAQGAGRLISLADSSPNTPAGAVFPTAARANPSVFYDSRGRHRSVAEVYRVLVGRYDAARSAPPSTPTMMATGDDAEPAQTAAASAALSASTYTDTAKVTEAYAAAAQMPLPKPAPSPAVKPPETPSVFHSLFSTSGRPEPVAPLVSALWTAPLSPQIEPPAPPASAPLPASKFTVGPGPKPAAKPRPLDNDTTGDLFQSRPSDTRALFRGKV